MELRLYSLSRFGMALLMAVALGVVTDAVAEGRKPSNSGGARDVSRSFDRPSAASHPVGLTENWEDSSVPKIVVRDLDVVINDPVIQGESVALSTVGVEVVSSGGVRFHPLLSIAVDKTFEEAPGGQWLAVWNLGQKGPGVGDFLVALVPGSISRRKTSQSTLAKLQKRVDHFEPFYAHGSIKAPDATYAITDGFRSSYVRLALNGMKIGFGFISDRFWTQFLYRGYLLRRNDRQERSFQQTYLGLSWYDDVSASGQSELALASDSVRDIKFRMLANRSAFGRWVIPGEIDNFVQGYEHQLREHLWVTSNRLASDANEFHLGFEEFHRFTANGVPMALGGVLYYDPKLAPEPGQDRWSIGNPFDLTYNPFRDPEVLRLAEDGDPVPLALYTFQSNMALKPIITVDFLRPDNPRLRQAVTYWRRLGNEAIASASIFGMFYNGIRRALSHAANKKGLTWLSDNKVAMGIEELRLSLMSSLYFRSEYSAEALDRVDRLVVNPLVQSAREQSLRARLHYLALNGDGGRKALQTVRKLREKQIRKAVGAPGGQLTAQAVKDYRGYLHQQHHLERLHIYAEDAYISSIPSDLISESIAQLGRTLRVEDRNSVQELADFYFTISKRAMARSEENMFEEVALQANASLESIYGRSGKTSQDLEEDLTTLRLLYQQREEEAEKSRLKSTAIYFGNQLGRHLETLEAVVKHQGDPNLVSPWYVSRAALFSVEAPEAARINPWIAKKYRKQEKRFTELLDQAYVILNSHEPDNLSAWFTQERRRALLALRSALNVQAADLKVQAETTSSGHQP